MIAQRPLRRQCHLAPGGSDALRIAQLHKHLQFLVTEAKVLATRLLGFRDDCIRALGEQAEEQRTATQRHVALDVLEVLLQHEDVELHAAAAVEVHGLDVGRIGHEELVEEKTEAGGDECALPVAEVAGNVLVEADEVCVQRQHTCVGFVGRLVELVLAM